MAGVPVVGARIGGIIDLVTHEVNGLLYDPTAPDELSRLLMDLVDHPERISQLANNLPRVKSIADDAEEWEHRYAEVSVAHGKKM
jgi:glycosyltransferase involved in cell wall biosynthesis